MKTIKRNKYLLAITLCIFLIFTPSFFASAAELDNSTSSQTTMNNISFTDKEAILKEFVSNGVSTKQALDLVSKFEKGEIWDSLRSDTTPVKEEREITAETIRTVQRYEDGSIAISKVRILKE